MTDFEKLKVAIKRTRLSMVVIAEESGMLRETLYNRLKGKGEFKASEISALSKTLHLSRDERDEIFFPEMLNE